MNTRRLRLEPGGWLAAAPATPRRVFVTHGEPVAADALRQHLRRALALEVTVPEQGESYASE
jgi:metallo-beta-lactamase family protein